jgi:flagellar hook-basal body complex protein FliE
MAYQPIAGVNPGLRTSALDLDPRHPRPAKPPAPVGPGSFRELLSESFTEVERLQAQADVSIKQLVSGEVKDVTDAVMAVEKADVAFRTMMQVRNRLVAAYEEIIRMQV